METIDIKMLVAFGKVGVQLLASRLLSLVALFGVVALSGYSVYMSSWQGAACVAILALFVFQPALKAERKGSGADSGKEEAP